MIRHLRRAFILAAFAALAASAHAQQSARQTSLPQLNLDKAIMDGVLWSVRLLWPYILVAIALAVLRGVINGKERRLRAERARQRRREDADYLAESIAEKMARRQ